MILELSLRVQDIVISFPLPGPVVGLPGELPVLIVFVGVLHAEPRFKPENILAIAVAIGFESQLFWLHLDVFVDALELG